MKLILKLLVSTLLMLFGTVASASEYWVDGGAGVSSAGMALGIGFSHVSKSLALSARFTHSEEFPEMWGPEPRESIQDMGILLGLAGRSNGKVFMVISAGPGYMTGVRRGEKLPDGFINLYDRYEKISYSAAALLIQTEFFMKSWSGFTFFANMNQENSCAGMLLTVRLGKIQ